MEDRKKETSINKAIQPPYSKYFYYFQIFTLRTNHQNNSSNNSGQSDPQFSVFTQYFPFQLDSSLRNDTSNQPTTNNYRATTAYFNPWEWGNSSSFINGISNTYNSSQSHSENSTPVNHTPITSSSSGSTQISFNNNAEPTYASPLNYGAENLFGLKFWNTSDSSSNPSLHTNNQQSSLNNAGLNSSRSSSFFSQPPLMDWRVNQHGPMSEAQFSQTNSTNADESQGVYSYDQMTNEDDEAEDIDLLERLTGFGFSPSSVVTALQLSNNDEYEALAWLQNQSQAAPSEPEETDATSDSIHTSKHNYEQDSQPSSDSIPLSTSASGNTSSWKKLFENLTSKKLELSKEIIHITHSTKEEKAPKDIPSDIDTNMICKFFLNGYCKNGKECPFVHDPRLLEVLSIASLSHFSRRRMKN